jgi:hypothetical protein
VDAEAAYQAFCNDCLAQAPGPNEESPRDQTLDLEPSVPFAVGADLDVAESDEVFGQRNADLTNQAFSHDLRDAQVVP